MAKKKNNRVVTKPMIYVMVFLNHNMNAIWLC